MDRISCRLQDWFLHTDAPSVSPRHGNTSIFLGDTQVPKAEDAVCTLHMQEIELLLLSREFGGQVRPGSLPHHWPIPEQFLQWDSKRCWGSLPFASLVSFTLTQGSPAEHCTVMRRSMLLTSPVSDFNDVAGWYMLVR